MEGIREFAADRLADARRSDLRAQLILDGGYWRVPSRSNPRQVYEQWPEWFGPDLMIRCNCPSGRARYRAQIPCVHAGVVVVALETVGALAWAEADQYLLAVPGDGYDAAGLPSRGGSAGVGAF